MAAENVAQQAGKAPHVADDEQKASRVPGWLRTVLVLDAGQHAVLPLATWCYRRSSRHRRFRLALLQIPDAAISRAAPLDVGIGAARKRVRAEAVQATDRQPPRSGAGIIRQ